MQIEVKIDNGISEPKVVIWTDKMTDEVAKIVKRLSDDSPQVIAGFRGDNVVLLEQSDIIRIYTADSKVFAETEKNEYQLRLRLYELENRLDKEQFVRISVSEIINLKKVKGFDLSFTGTICVTLSNGTVTYAAVKRQIKKMNEKITVKSDK